MTQTPDAQQSGSNEGQHQIQPEMAVSPTKARQQNRTRANSGTPAWLVVVLAFVFVLIVLPILSRVLFAIFVH